MPRPLWAWAVGRSSRGEVGTGKRAGALSIYPFSRSSWSPRSVPGSGVPQGTKTKSDLLVGRDGQFDKQIQV